MVALQHVAQIVRYARTIRLHYEALLMAKLEVKALLQSRFRGVLHPPEGHADNGVVVGQLLHHAEVGIDDAAHWRRWCLRRRRLAAPQVLPCSEMTLLVAVWEKACLAQS